VARVATFASVVSVLAGAWGLFAQLSSCHSGCLPASYTAPNQGFLGLLFLLLSVVLVIDGLVGFVGPKAVFYAAIVFALLIDVVELLSYSSIVQVYFYVTLALVTLSLVLSLGAARARTGVSEQSHPMNLPVFG
jgi:hypothetical protein